ncbi:MAG: hypothetical protein ACUVXA_09750 [Candidatus Jordarchaeum sp.]|uniref:hypothetical protein n=1 Tax=Candidatus Jordarchaeum sp. TaxID=2823881 RepID=UPI00404B1F38
MMSIIDKVFKKVINDKDIFNSPFDRDQKNFIPVLFEGSEWKNLSKLFKDRNRQKFFEIIDMKVEDIIKQEKNAKNWRLERIKELRQRAELLKRAFDKKPYLFKKIFETIDWYGLVECKLPSMDDYGKVIERYDFSIVFQFFCDKIRRANFPQNQALTKILEYINELFKWDISSEEVAYFIRKIESLKKCWEVLE